MPPELTEAKSGPPGPLYAKLRPGPNGLGAELVASHQRARLYGAMVEMVVARGYAGTSIKGVCALAGVSRRTFYDLFGDEQTPPKEACFLATYEHVVSRTARRVSAAYRSERDPERRLRRAFEQFAQEAAEQPKLGRLALVEALAAGPSALQLMDRGRRAFEKLIGASFGAAPDGVTLPPLLVKGIVCGVERITRRRLLGGRVDELPALADELLRWTLSYRSPAAARLAAASPACRERPAPWRLGVQAENDRIRILRGAARIAAAKGYSQLTPAQIVCAAGVSEGRFDELFGSTEQCFLEALDRMGLEALVCAAKGSRGGEDPLVALHRGIAALMRHLATNPLLVRVAFVEILAVGPAGVERRERLLDLFAELLTRSVSRSGRASGLVTEASVGAIWGIVRHHATRGGARLLPGVAAHATYLALAPVVGADAAVETILRADG
jgi:AcrR family transcriptional regulator